MSDEIIPDLLKPDQLFAGRYRIVKFLAKGGMGAVFVGEHTATEQRVAIKVLWPNVLASKSAVEKFELEARVAGRVRSENIVQVIDAGYDAETSMPFLVMELLEGKNLETVVETEGPLPPVTLLAYMAQVASGLDKAHGYTTKEGERTPIVHRDLKPENLFLARRDDGTPLVKVLDFGIAKVVSEGTKMSREVKGTPLFMAYEQAAGGKITPATDIWALGLIVFWLLTGKHYWKAAEDADATITTLFGEVLSLEMAPATQRAREYGVTPSFPPAFDAWFARCVNRDISQRFTSAGQAVTALAEALGLPVPSVVLGALPPVPPTLVNPTQPALASSAMGQSSAGLASTKVSAQPQGKSKVGLIVGAVVAVAAAAATGVGVQRLGQPNNAAQVEATPEPPKPAASPEASAPTVSPTPAPAASSAAAQASQAPAAPQAPAVALPTGAGVKVPIKAGGPAKPPTKADKDTYGSR